MDFQIPVAEAFHYPDHTDGITLPVTLSTGEFTIEAIAKVDTGAALCLFSREIGLHLGLEIERGLPTTLSTLSGSLEAFGHEVRIQVSLLSFDTVIYFTKHPGLPRNFLGRQGWLRNVRLGLVDYENLPYLAKYTE